LTYSCLLIGLFRLRPHIAKPSNHDPPIKTLSSPYLVPFPCILPLFRKEMPVPHQCSRKHFFSLLRLGFRFCLYTCFLFKRPIAFWRSFSYCGFGALPPLYAGFFSLSSVFLPGLAVKGPSYPPAFFLRKVFSSSFSVISLSLRFVFVC